MTNPHVTYVLTATLRPMAGAPLDVQLSTFDVFMLGRRLGTVIRGEASAYLRTPSGKGRLYPSFEACEQAIDRAAARAAAGRTNDARSSK